MNDALQRYIEAATGLTQVTAKKAERIVKGLVRSGEAAGDQVGDLVDDLMERSGRNREAIVALVKAESTRVVRGMGLATNKEIDRLQKQVADLKRSLTRSERASASSSSDSSPSASTSKKTGAKKTGAKKTGAKKTGAKKTGAKKTAAKTTAPREPREDLTVDPTVLQRAADDVRRDGTTATAPAEASAVIAERIEQLAGGESS